MYGLLAKYMGMIWYYDKYLAKKLKPLSLHIYWIGTLTGQGKTIIINIYNKYSKRLVYFQYLSTDISKIMWRVNGNFALKWILDSWNSIQEAQQIPEKKSNNRKITKIWPYLQQSTFIVGYINILNKDCLHTTRTTH